MHKRFLKIAAVLIAAALLTTAARADVAFVAILKVQEQNQEAFEAVAVKMTEASKTDKGMLIYEFARVDDRVYGYERYTDDDAHERHQLLIEPFLPELTSLAEFEAIITLTPLSDRVKSGFQKIGAKVGVPIVGVAQGRLGN